MMLGMEVSLKDNVKCFGHFVLCMPPSLIKLSSYVRESLPFCVLRSFTHMDELSQFCFSVCHLNPNHFDHTTI